MCTSIVTVAHFIAQSPELLPSRHEAPRWKISNWNSCECRKSGETGLQVVMQSLRTLVAYSWMFCRSTRKGNFNQHGKNAFLTFFERPRFLFFFQVGFVKRWEIKLAVEWRRLWIDMWIQKIEGRAWLGEPSGFRALPNAWRIMVIYQRFWEEVRVNTH